MSICFMTRWRPDRGSGVLDEAEEESSEKSDHDLERAELHRAQKKKMFGEKKRRRRYINQKSNLFVISSCSWLYLYFFFTVKEVHCTQLTYFLVFDCWITCLDAMRR